MAAVQNGRKEEEKVQREREEERERRTRRDETRRDETRREEERTPPCLKGFSLAFNKHPTFKFIVPERMKYWLR